MSENEAEQILTRFEKWDHRREKHAFIERMERKMFKRNHSMRRRRH